MPIEKVGEPFNVEGYLFFRTKPMPEFNIGEGFLFQGVGADFLVALWGERESKARETSGLWLFMRNNDGKGNPDWRSIREIDPDLPPTSKSNVNDKLYAEIWIKLNILEATQ